jgi:hypothetical protein
LAKHGDSGIVLPLKMEHPTLEVGESILGGVGPIELLVDRGDRRFPILLLDQPAQFIVDQSPGWFEHPGRRFVLGPGRDGYGHQQQGKQQR